MPSETFFRLPEEKRQRILDAAWEEFTRVPYADASINRIILRSSIPRGSFYQYFTDKGDLFLCLIGPTRDRLMELFHSTLVEKRGDIFAMPCAILDGLVTEEGSVAPEFAQILSLLRLNVNMDMQKLFFAHTEGEICPRALFDDIDRSLLRSRDDDFIDNLFYLLVGSVVFVIGRTLQHPEDFAHERERMLGRIEIIKRGAAAETEGGIRE